MGDVSPPLLLFCLVQELPVQKRQNERVGHVRSCFVTRVAGPLTKSHFREKFHLIRPFGARADSRVRGLTMTTAGFRL